MPLISAAVAMTATMADRTDCSSYGASGVSEKSRSSENRYVSKKHFFRQVPPLKTHDDDASGCEEKAARTQPRT
jgi:hypothetical protein